MGKHHYFSSHKQGIARITAQTTGSDIANYYLNAFQCNGIILSDTRNNFGHSLQLGPKDKVQRIWLDQNNNKPLGESIFAVEPGGFYNRSDEKGVLVGRFEESIYIPKEGNAVILGSQERNPLII